MASRLVLVAHGVTANTRSAVFGDRSALLGPVPPVVDWPARIATASCGPEPACVQTAAGLPLNVEVVPELGGPAVGSWAGRTLDEVAAEDPAGLAAWLTDPHAVPHGGESLASLVQRVGSYCDERDWQPGQNAAVVTPLVARAAVVHALGAEARAIFRVDVAPLGRVGLSRHGTHWRLQRLN